ncbi:MAG: zinc-dependent peptidase [Brachymonas sp.]|nr:zinc-dependent peptidase [Brachymonas sp.]
MWHALQQWWGQRRLSASSQRIAAIVQRRPVQEDLWHSTVIALPFIAHLTAQELARLRVMVSLFLDSKEFSGAQGLQVSDAQAVMVACQACLPILHIAPPHRPDLALAWYDGFVGIVLHPAAVRARREWVDEDGVAHSGSEELTGEILEGGPLMLAWSDVDAAGETANEAYNVVIHEFIHVMDVRDGAADGCPPMPAEKRQMWLRVLHADYSAFCEACEIWQRFGSLSTNSSAYSKSDSSTSSSTESPGADAFDKPLLDTYGASSVDEFFAVACEAYFVQRLRFAKRYPMLTAQFDAFFKPASH